MAILNFSRPDFNNDLGDDSNSGPVLSPFRIFKSNLSNVPSLAHSNLVSDEIYICSGLPFMISWWLQYLAKGLMPDFNNDPGKDFNSCRSLTLQGLFKTDVNNDPLSKPFPTMCQMENTSVQVSYLLFSGGCHICPRAACLTSIMSQEVTRIVATYRPISFI